MQTIFIHVRNFITHTHTLVIVLLFIATTLRAQTLECGSSGLSPAERIAILEQLPQGVSQSSSPWKIAVWVYHLREDDGSTILPLDPNQSIGEVNQHYDGLFEFTICGETYIDNDQFSSMNLNGSSSDLDDLLNYVDGLNQPLSENCVRIFLCGTNLIFGSGDVSGYAFDRVIYNDEGAVFIATSLTSVWSHELGHYFGLPHTFSGTQYVNSPVLINGEQYSCYQTGDGFCDTPADPGSCNVPNCVVNCNGAIDPLGVQYTPDPTLLMSYFGSCRIRFSDEQKQAMRTLYLYHPNYAAILNAPAECVIPEYGKIERNCTTIPNPLGDFSPIVGAPVEVRGALNICNGQNNLTDNAGRYETEPCTINGPALRRVLPDKGFGDPLNGVSTFDLVLISQDILDIAPFENPFQMIAADANNSGSITSFDVVAIRRVILGMDATFPAGNWRYIPKICTETQSFKNDFYDGNPFDAVYVDPFQGFTRHYKGALPNIPSSDTWMDHFSLVTTSSSAHNETAWSFTGVKVGDVNCSADVDGFIPEPGDDEFFVQPNVSTSILSGTAKKIQVLASVSSGVVAWQFGVKFASDSLTILDILPGNTGTIFDAENFYHSTPAAVGSNDGIFRSLWYAPNGAVTDVDGKILFEIIVEATNNIAKLEDIFKLDNRLLEMKFFDNKGEIIDDVTLTIRLEDVSLERNISCPSIPKLNLRVDTYPVPFDSEIFFEFELPKEETVNLSLFDAIGNVVSDWNAYLPAGYHQVTLPNVKNCPAGLYWYSLKAGQYNASDKLIKN